MSHRVDTSNNYEKPSRKPKDKTNGRSARGLHDGMSQSVSEFSMKKLIKINHQENPESQILEASKNQESGIMLPKLSEINLDMVKMCIAPPKILNFNSKENLEKRNHKTTFAELTFKLEKEPSLQEDSEDRMQIRMMSNMGHKRQKRSQDKKHSLVENSSEQIMSHQKSTKNDAIFSKL